MFVSEVEVETYSLPVKGFPKQFLILYHSAKAITTTTKHEIKPKVLATNALVVSLQRWLLYNGKTSLRRG
ncbi:MAG: hypothetical protein ACJAYN_000457 [Bermanella sp.]|jgi:hypothetical protein|nr:hypothetical protein CXF81_08520 [Glaciecola sp. 33A]